MAEKIQNVKTAAGHLLEVETFAGDQPIRIGKTQTTGSIDIGSTGLTAGANVLAGSNITVASTGPSSVISLIGDGGVAIDASNSGINIGVGSSGDVTIGNASAGDVTILGDSHTNINTGSGAGDVNIGTGTSGTRTVSIGNLTNVNQDTEVRAGSTVLVSGTNGTTVTSTAGSTTVSGNTGTTVSSSAGSTTVSGNTGATVSSSAGSVTVSGNTGTTVSSSAGSTTVSGNTGATVSSSAGSVTVSGNTGTTVSSSAGSTTVSGNTGATVSSSAGSVTVSGNTGVDIDVTDSTKDIALGADQIDGDLLLGRNPNRTGFITIGNGQSEGVISLLSANHVQMQVFDASFRARVRHNAAGGYTTMESDNVEIGVNASGTLAIGSSSADANIEAKTDTGDITITSNSGSVTVDADSVDVGTTDASTVVIGRTGNTSTSIRGATIPLNTLGIDLMYKSGTFTPQLTGGISGVFTASSAKGVWSSFGYMMHLSVRITYTAHGSAAGSVVVANLPKFTTETDDTFRFNIGNPTMFNLQTASAENPTSYELIDVQDFDKNKVRFKVNGVFREVTDVATSGTCEFSGWVMIDPNPDPP